MESSQTPLQVSDFIPQKSLQDVQKSADFGTPSTTSTEKRVSIISEPIQEIEIPSENVLDPAQASGISTSSTSWTGVPKDSCRSWIVALAAFCLQVFVTGQLHVYGIFFNAIIEDMHCSKGAAAWVGSLAYGLTMLLAPLSSVVVNNFGNHVSVFCGTIICCISLICSSFAPSVEVLFFTFSVIFGLGNALAYTPTMTIAGDYFDKYLTVAIGMMVAGTSMGTLILSPITQALIDAMGWRATMRVCAIFATSGFGTAYVFMPKGKKPHNPHRDIKKSPARRVMKDLHLWKNRVFVLWTTGITLAMFGYYIPYVHLVSHVTDLGISPDKGSLLLMVLGGSTAVGRIMFGKIVDMGWMDRLHMHQMSLVITGTGAMILPCIKAYWGLMIYVICAGLVDGCMVVLLPVLTTTLMGAENKVVAWGYLTGVSAITFTIGPPTAGWIYDATGSYNLAFHLAGVPIILGAVVLFFIPWAQRTANSTNAMTAAQSYVAMSAPLQSEDEMSIISGSHSDHTAHLPSSPEEEVTVFTQDTEVKTPTQLMIEFSPTDKEPSSDAVQNTLQSAAQILSDKMQYSMQTTPSQPGTPTSSLSITSTNSIVRQRPRPSGSQLASPAYPLSNIMSPQISLAGDLDMEVNDLMNIQVHSPDTTNLMIQDAIQEIADSPLTGGQCLAQARSRTMSMGSGYQSQSSGRSRTISCNDPAPSAQLAQTPLSGLDVMFQPQSSLSSASPVVGSPLDDSFVHVAPALALSSGQAPVNSLPAQNRGLIVDTASDPESHQPHSLDRTEPPRNVTSDELIFGVPSIH